MKKLLSLTLAVILVFCLFPVSISASAASNLTLNADSAELFTISESDSDVLTIPDDVNQSFTFKVIGTDSNVSWSVTSGYTVNIDSNGTVTPVYEIWYNKGNISSTSPIDGYTSTTKKPKLGESVVEASVDGVKLSAKVVTKDYALYYAQEVMNKFAEEKLTDDLTTAELLDAICSFPAQYDYSPYYSGYVGMIVHGGGDCWASTSAINYLCALKGLKYHTRYAADDPFAGSGHRNTAVIVDGEVYVLEAGYTDTAPRYYNVNKLTGGFSYTISGNNARIYMYDGDSTVVNIPETIDGYTVTTVGDSLVYYNQLYAGVYTTEVSIPSTVTSIEPFALSDIEKLENIFVDDNNTVYKDVDGVVYSKDGKTLELFPNGKSGDYAVEPTVEKIGDYAFYYSKKLTSVKLPQGVKTIGEGAFGDCSMLTSVELPDTLTTISRFAFYNTESLAEITIPRSVTEIDDYAFNNSSIIIKGYKDSYAQSFAESNNLTFEALNPIVIGDADLDGEVTIRDVTAIQKHLAKITVLSDDGEKAADVDADGNVSISDATMIQRKLAGLINKFPAEQ